MQIKNSMKSMTYKKVNEINDLQSLTRPLKYDIIYTIESEKFEQHRR